MSNPPEILQAIAADKPQAVSEFFASAVQQLLEDQLDHVVSTSFGTKNVQVLHLIDAHPPGGEPLRYHYAYESFDTKDPTASGTPTVRYGIVVANTGLTIPGEAHIPQTARGSTTRHYHYDPGHRLDAVTREETAPGQRYVRLLEDFVMRPGRLEDASDERTTRMLKEDITRLLTSTPVHARSSLLNQIVSL